MAAGRRDRYAASMSEATCVHHSAGKRTSPPALAVRRGQVWPAPEQELPCARRMPGSPSVPKVELVLGFAPFRDQLMPSGSISLASKNEPLCGPILSRVFGQLPDFLQKLRVLISKLMSATQRRLLVFGIQPCKQALALKRGRAFARNVAQETKFAQAYFMGGGPHFQHVS